MDTSTVVYGIAYFLPLIEQSHAVLLNAVAASTFFMWDYCITIDAEVELIWRSPWTWITALFVLIRYLSLTNAIIIMMMSTNVSGALNPSQRDCSGWLWFEVVSAPVLLLCVEILLIARVFAFYGGNRILLGVLISLFVCANAARIAVLAIMAPGVTIIQNPVPPNLPFGACLLTKLPTLISNSWIPELIPETLLFALVAVKIVRENLRPKIATSHVLAVLIRDGSWAFVLIFVGSLWAALQFELTSALGLIPLAWMISLLGFCGSRLILNLRSAAKSSARYLNGVEAIELNYARNSVSVVHEIPELGRVSSILSGQYDFTSRILEDI